MFFLRLQVNTILYDAGEEKVGEWVGRVGGGHEEADSIAAQAGLVNLGEVIPGKKNHVFLNV